MLQLINLNTLLQRFKKLPWTLPLGQKVVFCCMGWIVLVLGFQSRLYMSQSDLSLGCSSSAHLKTEPELIFSLACLSYELISNKS